MDIKKINKFLTEKPGFLKKGPKEVLMRLSDIYNEDVTSRDLELVKTSQKAIRASLKASKGKMDTKPQSEKTSDLKASNEAIKLDWAKKSVDAAIKHFSELGPNDKKDRIKKAVESVKKSIEQRLAGGELIPKESNVGIHMVSGCWHFPFHNKQMYKGVLELLKDLGTKVKGFHLLGDTLDLNSLSKHTPGQLPIPGVTLGMEYKGGNEALDGFDKVLPKGIQKTYLFGNHEDRYFRHIKDVDNSKYADALISPTQALKLSERGYTIFENWKEDFFMIGDHLQGIHGEYCSKNPARTHMEKMKSSVIFAHTHRIDICYDGEKAGFNIGWGGDKDSAAFSYVSRITKLNWLNGFALVHIDKEGYFHTQVIPVYNDKFWYNGKEYGN